MKRALVVVVAAAGYVLAGTIGYNAVKLWVRVWNERFDAAIGDDWTLEVHSQ